jgi:hypothetical protein
MKHKKIFAVIAAGLVLLLMNGCSNKKPQVELTRDNFPEFYKAKITKVYIYTYRGSYYYDYPIQDPKKGEVIKLCIGNANQTEYDKERFRKNRQTSKEESAEALFFETEKVIYSMRFGWNDEFVYGFWWESKDLLRVFKKWCLFEELSKADPSWPEPSRIKHPPKETEPNSLEKEPNQPAQKLLK